MRNDIKASGIVTGLLIIAAGVLLFLFNNGDLDPAYKHIVFSWPSLLVAIGFTCLFSRFKWIFGVVLMLVGGFFLMRKVGTTTGIWMHSQSLWTVLLVAFGVIIVVKAIWGTGHCHRRAEAWHKRCRQEGENFSRRHVRGNWKNRGSETGYIDRNYLFGGAKERIIIKDFKGGEINCAFGGMELDLMDAQLVEGVNILRINILCGGVVIFAPMAWKIEIRQSSMLGNFEDHRPKPPFEIDDKRLLVLEVSVMLGGGEIKTR